MSLESFKFEIIDFSKTDIEPKEIDEKELKNREKIYKAVEKLQQNKSMYKNMYTIWMEGFMATGQHDKASKLCFNNYCTWPGNSFEQACKLYSKVTMCKSYNEKNNSIWGCKLYDNEEDARKSFG